jgi:hypothetical protein
MLRRPEDPIVNRTAHFAPKSPSQRAPALAYQRQVELIMSEPCEDARTGVRKERLALAAVLLAVAVSVAGACIVIVESSSQAPRSHAGAGTPEFRANLERGEHHAR